MSLPNFLCIGAPKCGTTSLFEILSQHPEIGLSSFKEPHFFNNDLNWEKGLEWYENNYFSKLDSKVIGEFTPTYLSSYSSPLRIKNSLGPDVKFIVLLRNPVERSYSHYLHSKRDEYEHFDFIDAILAEEGRLNKLDIKNDLISFLKYSYVYQSNYAHHIKNYLKYFHKSQFHFVFFDDFLSKRKDTIDNICSFLNVRQNLNMELNIKSNPASISRSIILKKIMLKKTFANKLLKILIPSFKLRQRIRNNIHAKNNKPIRKIPLTIKQRNFCYDNYFSKQILELEKILGINLDIWRT